jgi:hypothetical protein
MTAADIVETGLVVAVQVEDGACTCLVPFPFFSRVVSMKVSLV